MIFNYISKKRKIFIRVEKIIKSCGFPHFFTKTRMYF
jgi:hypothetical protein